MLQAAGTSPPTLPEIKLNKFLLAWERNNGSRRLFAASLGKPLPLDEVPLPGVPTGKKVSVDDLSVLYATGKLDHNDLTAIRGLAGAEALLPSETELAQGFSLSAVLNMGDTKEPVTFTVGGDGQGGGGSAPTNAPALQEAKEGASGGTAGSRDTSLVKAEDARAEPVSGAKWFNIQKSLGPVNFRRAGLAVDKGSIELLLDVAVTFSGLTLAVEGLGVRFALDFRKEPMPLIPHGLAVDFEKGSLKISGGLLRTPDGQ